MPCLDALPGAVSTAGRAAGMRPGAIRAVRGRYTGVAEKGAAVARKPRIYYSRISDLSQERGDATAMAKQKKYDGEKELRLDFGTVTPKQKQFLEATSFFVCYGGA